MRAQTLFFWGGLGSSIRSTWTDDQQIIATNTNQTDPPAINCIRLPNPKSQFWLQMFSLIKSNVGRGFIEFLAYMLANLWNFVNLWGLWKLFWNKMLIGSIVFYYCIAHMLNCMVYIYVYTFTIKNQPSVGKYTIHGSYGLSMLLTQFFPKKRPRNSEGWRLEGGFLNKSVWRWNMLKPTCSRIKSPHNYHAILDLQAPCICG